MSPKLLRMRNLSCLRGVRSCLAGPSRARSIAALCALLLAGCAATPQSSLDPAGSAAERIAGLQWLIFWPALAIFVVVEGLLIASIVRFRRRPGENLPVQTEGKIGLEIAWTIAPALAVIVLLAFSIRTQFALAVQPTDALQISVTGHRWWWEVAYPESGVLTANEIYIPVGQDVTLTLQSEDVIHSFWVPQLAGKTDMLPGHTNRLSFRATRAGTYRGQCAELCGASHALMQLRVVALEADAFTRWLAAQQQPLPSPSGAAAAQGEIIFRSATNKCALCHTITGTNTASDVGPNLSNFGERSTIGAGTLENTPDNLAAWLRDPGAIKPGNTMAKVITPGALTEQDIADLVAFLQQLKAPGT